MVRIKVPDAQKVTVGINNLDSKFESIRILLFPLTRHCGKSFSPQELVWALGETFTQAYFSTAVTCEIGTFLDLGELFATKEVVGLFVPVSQNDSGSEEHKFLVLELEGKLREYFDPVEKWM